MRVTLVSLFPESVRSYLDASILGRAQASGALVVDEVQIRDHALDKHKKVDDTPAGGGAGMVMKVDVLHRAIEAARTNDARVILLDPAGPTFSQQTAKRLAAHEHLILVCGRYEGVDARVHAFVDEVISVGDFVLTGGELAAAIVVDATCRERPGVLGNGESVVNESHQAPLVEHRQYTRPTTYENMSIPSVLLSGDHKRIEKARRNDAIVRTREVRPDLEGARLELDETVGDLAWE